MGKTNKRQVLTSFEVSVTTTGDVSIATVVGNYDGQEYFWTGSAKRAPDDRPVPETGMKLALSRALESAASQLSRQSDGALKCNTDNREQRRQARTKARDEEKIKFYRIKKRMRRQNRKSSAS